MTTELDKLDASHLCVLKNWETVATMKDCAAQVDRYTNKIASKVCDAFHAKHRRDFERDNIIEKSSYFQLLPVPFVNWRDTKSPLLALGIEDIRVTGLLHLGGKDTFSAYVHSPYREWGDVTDSSTNQLNSIVPPPPSFQSSFDDPVRGYVFRMVIPPISPEDFCDPKKLENHVVSPLSELVAWFTANEKTLKKAFGLGDRKMRK